jgi:hypothetical protein
MLATSSQHARHKLVTSLAICTLCRGRREGAQHGKSVRNMGKVVRNIGKVVRNMEKVFATRCLDVGRNMLATSSQHVRHKLVTSLATCTLCQGRREGAQHGKRCSQHGKSCSQHSQHASQHHDPTANMFPNSNRVAEKVSDPSARIGRPGASSSVQRIASLAPKSDCD